MNIKIINPYTYKEDSAKPNSSSDILLCLNTPQHFQECLINLINIPSNPKIFYVPSPNIFWNTDLIVYNDTIEKTMKKVDNVHYLNNSTFTFNDKKEQYRVLGCLMWNDFNNLNEEFVTISLIKSLNFSKIKANSWFENPYNLEQFNKLNDKLLQNDIYKKTFKQYYKPGYFHPIISYLMYQESILFLKNELRKPFNGKTILITHNHPTNYSIYFSGIQTALKDSKIYQELNKKQNIDSFIGRKSSLEDILLEYKVDYLFNGHSKKLLNYKYGNTNIFSCDLSELNIDLNDDITSSSIKATVDLLINEHLKYIDAIKNNIENKTDLIETTKDILDIINSYSFISSLLYQDEWKKILLQNNVLIKEITKENIGLNKLELDSNKLNPQRIKMLLSFITQNYYSLQLLSKKYEPSEIE